MPHSPHVIVFASPIVIIYKEKDRSTKKPAFTKLLAARLGSLLILFIMSSCATVHIGIDILRGKDRDQELAVPPLVWKVLEQEKSQGSENIDNLNSAPLVYTLGRISFPPLAFWAVRINLASPLVQIVVGPEPLAYGFVPSVRVSRFAEQYGCTVAINTNPFDPVSDREGEERRVVGLAVQEGRIFSDPVPAFGALLIGMDGIARIAEQTDIPIAGKVDSPAAVLNVLDAESVRYGVGGFYQVLKDGIPLKGRTSRAPRSAVGVSRDGTTLILLAVDGRLLDSVGATEYETAQILLGLGAWDGLLLDGGGSTSLVIRKPNSPAEILNHPVHDGTLNRERAVATCLGIRLISQVDSK
ncbi:phosphodiester glycosidase family protein [Gracilinema caldarium]|uniref:phosphodiester glycosidase family protein n=1 Tax=Gracilinema caldarium TaxID=215591 RepID=UPI0026F31DA7|nr:phosphodiester glycosidase family protein [Gracilinema caldarium]